MKISIGYSDSQDRIWLRAGNEGPLWWVTRRLGLRLLHQWAELLERTAPLEAGGRTANAGEQLDRAERRRSALREHQAALEPAQVSGEGAAEDTPATPAPGKLVYSVEISGSERGMRLTLQSAGERQTIDMPRSGAHRVLAALAARYRTSGWFEASLPPWFQDEEKPESGRSVVS